METLHKWHLDRGWAGIGYNFYIRKDGSAYQGRPLAVDGIKGTNTSAAIEKTLYKGGAPVKGRYQAGSRGAVVRWIQQRLNTLTGCDLAEDGKYGHDTREAVWDWQESRGLTRDGKAGPDTITSLL